MSTSEAVSPYVAARHEWDERYGSLITQARNWRVTFQVSAVIALVAVTGATWLSVHSRTKVFVVALDHLGRSVAAGYADQTSVANDDRVRENILLGRAKMPGFRNLFSDEQVDDLIAYLHTL